MRTIKTNIESRVEQYKAVKNADSVKNLADGAELTTEYVHYMDEKQDKDGNTKEVEILSVKAVDGLYYGTNSATFIHDYLEIIDMFEGSDEPFTIVKDSNVSKAGRQFVYARLA